VPTSMSCCLSMLAPPPSALHDMRSHDDEMMDMEHKHDDRYRAHDTLEQAAHAAEQKEQRDREQAAIAAAAAAVKQLRSHVHDTSLLDEMLAAHAELNTPLAHARQPVYDMYWLQSRVEYTPDQPRAHDGSTYQQLGAWAVRALMTWQMVFNVSDAAFEFIIKMINCLIRSLGHGTVGGMPNTKGKPTEDWFPSSLHTLQTRLNTVHIGTREHELITRFVLCPTKECGARYHMAQARQLMVCQATLWVRAAPRSRKWVQQPCHTRLFRTVDRPVRKHHRNVGAGAGQLLPQKQPHVHRYERDAAAHRTQPEHEQELEQKQEQEHEQKLERPEPRQKRTQPFVNSGTARRSARLMRGANSVSVADGVAIHLAPVLVPAAVQSHPVFDLPPRAPPPPPSATAAYSTDYVPECMYPYCGIIAPLKIMMMRKGFEQACGRHQWRSQPGGATGTGGTHRHAWGTTMCSYASAIHSEHVHASIRFPFRCCRRCV
jgi:hypothetical protein